MRYAVAIDAAGDSYSAYVPDLPGCVATGSTSAEAEAVMRNASEFHLEGMREDGTPAPSLQPSRACGGRRLADRS